MGIPDSDKGNAIESLPPKVTVLDSMAQLKMPLVVLLIVSCAMYNLSKHWQKENNSWADLKQLKAQLMEAASVRQDASKVETKLSSMLKEVADFRQTLEQDRKLLADSQKTISSLDSMTTILTQQMDSCPEEIRTSMTALEAQIVAPGGEEDLRRFEQRYMPLMWKASRELRSRIGSATPEDISDLRRQVHNLRQLLQVTSSKIGKVDAAENMERLAHISELEKEIQRLEGEAGTNTDNLPAAFAALSESRVSSEELKRAHHTKSYALPPSTLHVKGVALKCMQS